MGHFLTFWPLVVSLRTVMVLVSVLFNLLMHYNEWTMKLMYYNEWTMKFKVYWKVEFLAILYLMDLTSFFFIFPMAMSFSVQLCPVPFLLSQFQGTVGTSRARVG